MSVRANDVIVHADAHNVLSSMLSGNDGVFHRYALKKENDKWVTSATACSGDFIVLWTTKLERYKKAVEWLFRASIEEGDDQQYAVTMNSIKEEAELPEDALANINLSRSNLASPKEGAAAAVNEVKCFMKNCTLTVRNAQYGQSIFSLKGKFDHAASAKDKSKPTHDPSSASTTHNAAATAKRTSEALKSTAKHSRGYVADAIKLMKYSIFKQHENSAKVDEERYICSVAEIEKEVGQLTDPQERTIMKEAKNMLEAKRVWKCISHAGLNPIRISKCYESGTSVPWCKAEAVIHTSTKQLLSYLLNFDSLERTMNHQFKHNYLSSSMRVGGKGGITDERYFFYSIEVGETGATLTKRRFEVRVVWEKGDDEESDEKGVYRLAFCPAKNCQAQDGTVVEEIKAKRDSRDTSSPLAETKGIYELREIAENITELTLIRQDDLCCDISSESKEADVIESIKGIFTEVQKKYERNWKVVDSEVRDALVETMRKSGKELRMTAEQEDIFRALDDVNKCGKDWKTLRSPTPGVKMWIKGDGSIRMQKVEGIVDCTAEEAAAAFFNYCSIERTQNYNKEGGLVQLEVKGRHERICNEKTFATVKKVPFPLTSREFIFRHIWKMNEEEDSVSVGIWPSDDFVEYGSNFDQQFLPVRGTMKGLFKAINICDVRLGVNQCKVTYFVSIDLGGGFLPTAIMSSRVPNELMAFKRMVIDKFRSDEEVDSAALTNFADVIRSKRQVYTSDEIGLLKRGREFYRLRCDEAAQYKFLESPDPGVEMKEVHVKGDSLASVVGVVTVDADVATCLAYEFIKDSRDSVAKRKSNKIVETAVHKLSDHSHNYLRVRDLGKRGLSNREFRLQGVWQVCEDGAAFLAYEDTSALDKQHPDKIGNVAASAQTACVFEPLPAVCGIPQTRVTLASRVDCKASYANASLGKLFNNLSKLRLKFQRDHEIDEASRALISRQIQLEVAKDKICQHKTFLEHRFVSKDDKRISIAKDLKSGSSKTTALVRASLEDAAAYLFDYECRANRAFGDLKRTAVEREGKFELLVTRTVIQDGVKGALQKICEFHSTLQLTVIDRDTIAIILDPVEHKSDASIVSSKLTTHVKCKERSAIRLSRIRSMETSIEFVGELDFEIPRDGKAIITNELKRQLQGYKAMSIYFLNLLSGERLDEVDEKDGQLLAEIFVNDGVKEAIKKCGILKACQTEFPWFEGMMEEVMNMKLRPAADSIETKAECLSIEEARKIGGSLSAALALSTNPKAAVDEWILQHKALQDIDGRYHWMRHMINAVAIKLLGKVGWGVKSRVFVGAALSTVDLVTDVFVTYTFWRDRRDTFFQYSVAMLGSTMFLMVLMSIVQNHKNGLNKILRDLILIVTGLKPAVSAYKVATAKEIEEGQTMNPFLEMSYSKGIEMFAEAIPGVLIQVFAIADDGGTMSTPVIVSLLSSALTTGFISATMSYDWDSNVTNRKVSPDFYGYLPDKAKKRMVVFIALVVLCSTMILIRGLILVLLSQIDTTLVTAYLCFDLGFYLLVKVIRNDFYYWLPHDGFFEIPLSLIFRVVVKTVTDFTCIVQFRHPNEVGGAYWLFNVLFSLIVLPALVLHPNTSASSDAEFVEQAKKACNALLPSAVLAFAAFFSVIKREYLITFYSLDRGKDLTMRKFLTSNDDTVKADAVFCNTKRHWSTIEGAVHEWVQKNWERWTLEQPAWFQDEGMRTNIPPYMIPVSKDRARSSKLHRRRRSSITGLPLKNKVLPSGGSESESPSENSRSDTERPTSLTERNLSISIPRNDANGWGEGGEDMVG